MACVKFTLAVSGEILLYCMLHNTSGKNHFHEMNGDVGMAQWK